MLFQGLPLFSDNIQMVQFCVVVLVCLMAVSSVKGSSVIVETQEHGTFCSSFLQVCPFITHCCFSLKCKVLAGLVISTE